MNSHSCLDIKIIKYIIVAIICIATQNLLAQKIATFKGIVTDNENKPVAFAYVYISGTNVGTVTNESGIFEFKVTSKHLKKKSIRLEVSSIGYITNSTTIDKNHDVTDIKVKIVKNINQLKGVEILGERNLGENLLKTTQMSTIKLEKDDILDMPSLLGEVDVIKTLQLLPGTTKGVEGSTDFFVRGGDADQNLLLFDGATVYNSGHLFGFLSVFNPGVIDNVELIKGAFPAQYGGRLSSIINVNTPTKIHDKFDLDGSVGIISSRLTLRMPIIKNKVSTIVSARRTYIDQVLLLISDDPAQQLPYYFYDVNAIVNWRPNNKHLLSLSVYNANDVMDISRQFRNDKSGRSGANTSFILPGSSIALRYKHLLSDNTSINVNLSRSTFNYTLTTKVTLQTNTDEIGASSGIVDYDTKVSINTNINKIQLDAGIQTIVHNFDPIAIFSTGFFTSFIPPNRSGELTAIEVAPYIEATRPILNDKILTTIGYRHSTSFQNDYFYDVFEPRIALKYDLTKKSAIKTSYTRTGQYIHRVSSNSVSLPIDLWYTVTKKIKPQYANQFALGYTKTFPDINSYIEIEGYYKNMTNITAYQEGTTLLFNTEFEESIVQGTGDSFGLEFLAKHKSKYISGWISYTWSITNRLFSEINQGQEFPAKYDRRHVASIVTRADITPRIKVSAVWEYASGSKFTAVLGQYASLNPALLGIELGSLYSKRNELSLSPSHRLDISVSYVLNKKTRWIGELQVSAYNVYNNANPVSVALSTNPQRGLTYQEISLFGFLPAISYKFKFK